MAKEKVEENIFEDITVDGSDGGSNFAVQLSREELEGIANAVLGPLIKSRKLFVESGSPQNTDDCLSSWMSWLRAIQQAVFTVPLHQLPVPLDVLSPELHGRAQLVEGKLNEISNGPA